MFVISWRCLIELHINHSLQKSSANPLSLSIYKLTGSRSLENQPITANLSKIALYWHSWFNLNSYILANEIAWLQIIGKWHTDLSGYTRGLLQACKTLVSIPLLSCSAVQCYFSRSTERIISSHAQEWKLNRFFSSDFDDMISPCFCRTKKRLGDLTVSSRWRRWPCCYTAAPQSEQTVTVSYYIRQRHRYGL